MKKQSIFLFTLLILTLNASAQRKIQQLDEEEAKKQAELDPKAGQKKGFDKDKLVFGGNVGASFQNGFTYILAQPLIGYRVKPKTILGSGFTYIYQGYKVNGVNYSSTAWGPILFARQHLLPQIFLHAEYQPINYEVQITQTKFDRQWSQNGFIGGGLGSEGVQVYVLYNLLYEENNSFYASPWNIRIGIMF